MAKAAKKTGGEVSVGTMFKRFEPKNNYKLYVGMAGLMFVLIVCGVFIAGRDSSPAEKIHLPSEVSLNIEETDPAYLDEVIQKKYDVDLANLRAEDMPKILKDYATAYDVGMAYYRLGKYREASSAYAVAETQDEANNFYFYKEYMQVASLAGDKKTSDKALAKAKEFIRQQSDLTDVQKQAQTAILEQSRVAGE